MSADRPWEQPAPEPARGPGQSLVGLDLPALAGLLAGLGEPAWRARQVYEGIYRHRWTEWERFTSLGKELRTRLAAAADLSRPVIVESRTSGDGSTKHAFRLADGRTIEGVHMPHFFRGSRAAHPPLRRTAADPGAVVEDAAPGLHHVTLCLSSQVGCALGCTFCATGQMGIVRNLTAAEIVGQVLALLDVHGHPAETPVNLVFMGMGEPLHNLDHVMAAFRLLVDPRGLAISPRRITLSTAGLVNGIARLGGFSPRPRLAVSLNATTDAARARIMPVARVWNLDDLAAALQAFPLGRGERITLEFVLLKGVTDSLEDGRRLAAFAARFPSKINLIPFNPHEGAGFEPPEETRIDALCALLAKAGLTVSVRRSRGQDVAGACGQLVREGRHGRRGTPP